MFIRKAERKTETRERFKDGTGSFFLEHITDDTGLMGLGTLFAVGTLKPGDSVGLHRHEGTAEYCLFLSGTGTVRDNDDIRTANPGDVNICLPGERHLIANTGNEDLVYLVLVLKEPSVVLKKE